MTVRVILVIFAPQNGVWNVPGLSDRLSGNKVSVTGQMIIIIYFVLLCKDISVLCDLSACRTYDNEGIDHIYCCFDRYCPVQNTHGMKPAVGSIHNHTHTHTHTHTHLTHFDMHTLNKTYNIDIWFKRLFIQLLQHQHHRKCATFFPPHARAGQSSILLVLSNIK